jgi:hypothetical protein
LLFQRLLQTAGAAGGVKDKRIFAVAIKRREKWDALDVVPVKVRKKYVGVDGMPILFLRKLFAQIAKSGAAVKNVNVPIHADLNARGITAVSQVF